MSASRVSALLLLLGVPCAASAATLSMADLVAGDLVISEVMVDPYLVGDGKGEFLEIYNASGADVDLEGLVLGDDGTDQTTVSSSVVVAAGGTALLGPNSDSAVNGGISALDYVYPWTRFKFDNTEDEIVLSYGGTELDRLAWGPATDFVVTLGVALSLDVNSLDATKNDSASYWCDASTPYGLGDLGTPGDPNEDCGLTALTVGEMVRGDLVISEVMVHPTRTDEYRGEWFEIYNASGGMVNLNGLVLKDLGTDLYTVPGKRLVQPGEYALLATKSKESLNGGLPAVDLVYTHSLFQFDNSDDEIILSNGTTDIDEIAWTKTSGLTTGASWSLDIDHTDADGNDTESNWCPSVESYGLGDFGSPGRANHRCGDGDLDGFVAANDCDDGNAAIHPGASELCNGVDDNCDELTDNDAIDATTWGLDADADTFGSELGAVVACDNPDAGLYVSNALDCDDGDALVNPNATEVCDSVDNNCDSFVDEGAAAPPAWWPDADADTFGDPTAPVVACDNPDAGLYVSNADDCDDIDPLVNPAATEVCEDGVDNDCDGTAFGCVFLGDGSLSTADAKLVGDTNFTDASRGLAGVGDINGDGLGDIAVGAPSTALKTTAPSPGAAYVVYGAVYGTHTLPTDSGAQLIGENIADQAGYSVGGMGDQDGDGYGDLVVGARDEATGGVGAGAVYLVSGPVSGSSSLALADGKLTGEAAGDVAGFVVSGGGDLDGDLTPDLAVGAYGNSDAYTGAGATYVFSGPVFGSGSLAGADAILTGEAEGDNAGRWINANGDVNGDGNADLLIGAYASEGDASMALTGRTYLVFGPVVGSVSLADANAKYTGIAAGDQSGYSVDSSGDMDGDGYADLLIGAVAEHTVGTNSGAAYLIRGALEASDASLSAVDATLFGVTLGDHAGCRVTFVGDTDDDGFDDLLIGANGQDTGGTSAGAAYVLYGPVSGSFSLSAADGRLLGEARNDKAGSSLAGAGDINGDGLADLLVGAVSESAGGTNAGAAYLFLGGGGL